MHFSAQPTSAYPAAQTAYVQPTHQAAYAATAPRAAQSYDTYQPAHSTGQYAYATRTQVQVLIKVLHKSLLFSLELHGIVKSNTSCSLIYLCTSDNRTTKSYLFSFCLFQMKVEINSWSNLSLLLKFIMFSACCNLRNKQDILHARSSACSRGSHSSLHRSRCLFPNW